MRIVNLLLIIFIAALFILIFSTNKVDPDLWGHLKYGQDIFTSHSLPRYDTYSYSAGGAPWINHEWLSELILFLIFKFTKSAGLVLFKYLTGLFLTFLVYLSVSRQTKSIYLRLLFMGIFIPTVFIGFAIRPQIFTYLFFAILIYLLDKFERSKDIRNLYVLPVIFLFWPNLHGGFVTGMGMLLFYVLFNLFGKAPSKKLIFISALSIAATFINPYGVKIWSYVFYAVLMPRPRITEWIQVGFTLGFLDYFVLCGAAVLAFIFSKRKRSLFEFSSLLVAFYFSFRHNRHIALFSILALIYLPKYFDSFASGYFLRLENRFSKGIYIPVLSALSAFFFLLTVFRGEGLFTLRVPLGAYPVDALKFMKMNDIRGNIFSSFDWAQMCIRELYPQDKVFFDGRYETVYNDSIAKDYFDTDDGKESYKDFLKKYPQTGIMFIDNNINLAKSISKDKDWVLVYHSSPGSIYLNSKTSENKVYIEKFKAGLLAYPKVKYLPYNFDDFYAQNYY